MPGLSAFTLVQPLKFLPSKGSGLLSMLRVGEVWPGLWSSGLGLRKGLKPKGSVCDGGLAEACWVGLSV